MYITYGKVFGGGGGGGEGGSNHIYVLVFPENGSISERTVNRALIVHTTL